MTKKQSAVLPGQTPRRYHYRLQQCKLGLSKSGLKEAADAKQGYAMKALVN